MNLKLKTGVGVLGKDGLPWAPGTIHGVSNGWMFPVPYSMEALAGLLADPGCVEIHIIDEDNKEFTLTTRKGD